jgi:hypothetical protein
MDLTPTGWAPCSSRRTARRELRRGRALLVLELNCAHTTSNFYCRGCQPALRPDASVLYSVQVPATPGRVALVR